MPVPDTYSRRLGSLREDTSYSSYSNRSSRPSSYLSSYTSKYSSLPPRPPTSAYDRKYSDSSSSTNRYLNGTLSSGRSGGYTSSSYVRSSLSPVRGTASSSALTGSSLRSSSASTTTTPSIADRLKSLELAAGDSNSESTGYRYRTRNRIVGDGSISSSNGRDRSGSNELGSSPLTGTSIALASRGGDESRSRTSSGGSNSASSTLERIRAARASNGISSALGDNNEVTLNRCSSDSDTTTSSSSLPPPPVATTCTNSVNSVDESDMMEGGGGGRVVEVVPSEEATCDKAVLNGNDTTEKRLTLKGGDDSNSKNAVDGASDMCGSSSNNIDDSGGGGPDKDNNGNPISDGDVVMVPVSRKVKKSPTQETTTCSTSQNPRKSSSPKVESDSNANVVERRYSATKLLSGAELTGVSKSLLKPNNLSGVKPIKSKVIVHKINIDGGSKSKTPSKSPTPEPTSKAADTSKNASPEPSVSVCVPLPRKASVKKLVPNGNESTSLKLSGGKMNKSGSSEKIVENRNLNSSSAASPRASPSRQVADDHHQDTKGRPLKIVHLKTSAETTPKNSRSPSPATVTITLAAPRKEAAAAVQESPAAPPVKVPTPPPLPTLSSFTLAAPPRSRLESSAKDVTDSMAGPHSSKYAGASSDSEEKSNSPRASPRNTDAAVRSPRRSNYLTNTSDSSDNESDEYSNGTQIGGRFRLKDSQNAGLTGLRNIGNTCFMNSVLQCLSNTRPLLEYMNKEGYHNDVNTSTSGMKGCLIRAFAQVIQELWRESRVVDTSAFKDQIQRFAPRFIGYSQQDAQEFLRYLLEGLHEDVNRVAAKPKPITTDIDDSLSDSQKAAESWKRYLRYDDSKIVDIFVGQLKSTLKCTTCGHCSVTFDPFWDLSLPIPSRAGTTKLSNCFDLFTKEEVLDGDEKPTCSKCQCRRKCTKSFSIQKFPRILVIHLKRFSPTERYRGKLSTTVDYPLKGLDLSAYSSNSSNQGSTFNLYGISNHSGSTYSGHYIAYCKHPYSGEWHCYNDSRVTPLPTNSVVTSEGYVLFYEMTNQTSHL